MTFRKSLKPALSALTLAASALFRSPAPSRLKPCPPMIAELKPCKVPGEKGKVAARCGPSGLGEPGGEVGPQDPSEGRRPSRPRPTPKPDPVFFFGGGPGEAIATEAGYLADSRAAPRPRPRLRGPARHGGARQAGLRARRPRGRPPELPRGDVPRRRRPRVPRGAGEDARPDALHHRHRDGRLRRGAGLAGLRQDQPPAAAPTARGRRRSICGAIRESVRSVVLNGVVPMDETLPISHAAAGQRSLDLLPAGARRTRPAMAGSPSSGRNSRR